MASMSSPTHPFPPSVNRRPAMELISVRTQSAPRAVNEANSSSSSSAFSNGNAGKTEALTVSRGRIVDIEKLKEKETRERKEEVNRKIASRKAISVILRREATKALIEKKGGPNNSKKLLPRTVLEALHERITALRWESALKVSPFFFGKGQLQRLMKQRKKKCFFVFFFFLI